MEREKITDFSYSNLIKNIYQKSEKSIIIYNKKKRLIYMAFTQKTSSTINIFISYADEDEQLMRELEKHLNSLVYQGDITILHRYKVLAGIDHKKKTAEHLASAQIVLLLVSANFIASDYCFSIELKKALEWHDVGKARIIPIILRPVNWEKTPFGGLFPLPVNGKAISSWKDQDEAFFEVAKGIQKVIEEIIQNRYSYTASMTSSSRLQVIKHNGTFKNKATEYQPGLLREKIAELKRSMDGKKIMVCKNLIQETRKQLFEISLRNIHYKDFNSLKQKLTEANEQIEHIKNKKIIELLTSSLDTIYSNIEESIIEIEVFLFVFEKILSEIDKPQKGDVDSHKIEEGVREFYESLKTCQSCLDMALQQFLN